MGGAWRTLPLAKVQLRALVMMYATYYHNLPKIAHPRKYVHPPFLNEVVAKSAFLSKVHPPIYVAVHAVMLSKSALEASLFKRRD